MTRALGSHSADTGAFGNAERLAELRRRVVAGGQRQRAEPVSRGRSS